MQRRITRSTAALLAIAALACGGGNKITNPIDGNVPCTITLSGSLTSTLTCTQLASAWGTATNVGAVNIGVTGGTSLSAAISFTGEPHVGTYTHNDAGAQSGISASSGLATWMAMVGGASATAGSYTLTLTSASGTVVPTGKGFVVHGTLDATLPAVAGTGATGSVTVHVTF